MRYSCTWLLGDRIFLALLIVALLLAFRSTDWTFGLLLLAATAVPLVWTMPHRMGVCVALDFLIRERFEKI